MCVLLSDAQRFVQEYFTLIAKSAAHIRISALPFAPYESILSRTFCSEPMLKVLRGKAKTWTPSLCTLQGHNSSITSIAFSHDGMRVVSGSYTGTIHIWDSTTGACLSVLHTDDTKEIH